MKRSHCVDGRPDRVDLIKMVGTGIKKGRVEGGIDPCLFIVQFTIRCLAVNIDIKNYAIHIYIFPVGHHLKYSFG